MNESFIFFELEKILQTVSNTSPGNDNINYLMLINSPLLTKKLLLSIHNDIWLKGDIMIPELKNMIFNKTPDSINSYRPSSYFFYALQNFFEKMIKNRL